GAALATILCGPVSQVSAELAAGKGGFAGLAKSREPMLRVMGLPRDAAYAIDRDRCPEALYRAACADWDLAVTLGREHGYRNAQATVLAPTGTIGLLMDCDTTGIEPDFSLVKFKKLAGGGYFKIVNQSVPSALKRLGYSEVQIREIVSYVSGTNTFAGAPHASRQFLLKQGLSGHEIEKAERALPGVFNVGQALAPWVLGAEAYARLGISKQDYEKPGFNLLARLGLAKKEIEEVNDWVIGRMTVEGAPHL